MKNRYVIDYNMSHEVIVEIDDEIFTEEKAKELNNFWSNAEYRRQESGSHLYAVLKMLASTVFYTSVMSFNVKRAFDWDEGEGVEGWPKLDGSEGIELITVDEFSWDEDEMTVRQVY